MKKGLLIVLYGILVFGITGCNNNNNNKKTKIKDKSDVIVVNDITLSVKEVNENGGTFIIKNNSDIAYTYGPSWYLEIKKDNEWYEIELDKPLVWNEVLNTLKAKEETEIIVEWSNTGYGKLKNGEYRIVKDGFRKEANPDSSSYSAYAEFKISK